MATQKKKKKNLMNRDVSIASCNTEEPRHRGGYEKLKIGGTAAPRWQRETKKKSEEPQHRGGDVKQTSAEPQHRGGDVK